MDSKFTRNYPLYSFGIVEKFPLFPVFPDSYGFYDADLSTPKPDFSANWETFWVWRCLPLAFFVITHPLGVK